MAKPGTFVANQVLSSAEVNAFGGAWDSYTPTWTGITTGNGVTSAAWKQIGRTTHWRAQFTLGTTSAVTGAVTVTLPTALRESGHFGTFRVSLVDTGTFRYTGQLNASSTTVVAVEAISTSSTYAGGAALTSTIPHTWANTDVITIEGCYEAAA